MNNEQILINGTAELQALNVNGYTKKIKIGNKLYTYLSWANAWSEFLKVFPFATYKIIKDDQMNAYFGNKEIGYCVYTEVTVRELTRKMWLPVLDMKNKTMKGSAYTYKTKYGENSVEAISIFDINKTIMRCLTKNLAMFGLGLYIYSSEDLPEAEVKEIKKITGLKTKIWNVLQSDKFDNDVRKDYIEKMKKGPSIITEEFLKQLTEISNGS